MSQSTLVPVPRTVAGACRELTRRPGLPFADHLPAEQIHQAFRQAGGVFRERIFTPAVTLWTFLSQVLDPDHSCRGAVARLLAWRTATGLPPCSADNGAYCKARGRLPEDMLADLTRQTGRGLMEKADQQWLWKGRQVKVVDGTGLSMPDTPENQKAYPQSSKIPVGVGFPLMRLVVVFSLAVGTVLDAAMGRFKGKGTGELSLFRSIIDAVLEAGDVLLGDRLYADYWDVARAQARGADVVMRLHAGRTPVRFRGRGHSTANRRVWWRKPKRPSWMSEEDYATYPAWLRLRAVRVTVRQRGFRTKRLVLVTTLLDAKAVTREDLADLYRRRWQAELYLRSLKTTLKMDILRGKTPEMVRKEVWAHLLVYNAVRTLMAQAARAAAVRPDEVSFAGALQTVNAFLPNLRSAGTEEEAARLLAVLLGAIAQHRVGNRPDRYEPRAVKRRPKNFPKLKEPRAQARRRLTERAKPSGKKR
jgi:hypothetical protein